MSEQKAKPMMTGIGVHLPDDWQCDRRETSTLWFKGQVPREGLARLHARFRESGELREGTERVAAQLEGNFGIVMQGQGETIAVTDHCNSVPILLGEIDDGAVTVVGSSGSDLAGHLSLGTESVRPDAALSVAMSGYTIGKDTLYRPIRMMPPGSVAVLRPGIAADVSSHHTYRPWAIREQDRGHVKSSLIDELGSLIERLIASTDGRPIVVPLSAGLDSRLVAAGLKEFGYRDARCFSYGLRGNHEAETSRHIAEQLGYEWAFVPYSIGRQRDAFAGGDHKAFVAACDHYAGVHFEQEYLALRDLRDKNWIPEGAIFVNGQSGDFITGNHIPAAFHGGASNGAGVDMRKRVTDALVAKHFALWLSLTTDEHKLRIADRLERALPDDPSESYKDFGLYEWSEFIDRQCKYVVQNVRVYEHFGYEWRMPLWDRNYMDFWANAPLDARISQNLYREVLQELDWGGVWQRIPVNKKAIRPHWIRPIRFGLKVMHAPLGRARWHEFERRILSYWMSNLCSHAIVPYRDVVGDGRGHRSAISWWVKAYLQRKGLDFSDVDERLAA